MVLMDYYDNFNVYDIFLYIKIKVNFILLMPGATLKFIICFGAAAGFFQPHWNGCFRAILV